jgi:hypothetical protein
VLLGIWDNVFMTASEAYRLFSALKLHFETASYDFFKYQGKARSISPKAFENRKDKQFFYRLAKKEHLEKFLVANFLAAKVPIWVGDLFDEEAEKNFSAWQCRMESITYTVKQEFNIFLEDFLDELVYENQSQYPVVINLLLRRKIGLETALTIEENYPFITAMDKSHSWDPIWKSIRQKLVKYKPFLSKYIQEYVGHKYIMRQEVSK